MSLWHSFTTAWLSWIVSASWQLVILTLLIALLTMILRSWSPRLRHSLWILVLLKVFLPPDFTAPFGIGQWGIEPTRQILRSQVGEISVNRVFETESTESNFNSESTKGKAESRWSSRTEGILCLIWMGGSAFFFLWGIAIHLSVLRWMNAGQFIDEGPIRIELERIALSLKLHTVPELVVTDKCTSPCLTGIIRPRIVLPKVLIDACNSEELHDILAHELIHWKRGDTLIGLLQFIVQGLFWFHPCIWWSNTEIKQERERACDLDALRLGKLNPQHYGESLLRILMLTRGKTLTSSTLAGVFEPGSRLQQRLEEIMNYQDGQKKFGWISVGIILATAAMLLPMGSVPGPHTNNLTAEEKPGEKQKTNYPQIVKTVPEIGATDVPVNLKEIRVTFDRNMGGGMSWTGGKPFFPASDSSKKARWVDQRTCVLPVKLNRGEFYRVGINSKSYQNFKSTDGVPSLPSVIYFVTVGADKSVKERVQVPKIVKLDPADGALEVDPSIQSISVTFDIKMGSGMSWTKVGTTFPKSNPGTAAVWSEDGKTCTLPVALEPGHQYQLGLNNLYHNNFQSEWGVPLDPVSYSFKTK